MTDRRNLDVVKAELNQLDSLCQQFHGTHKSYHDQLATSEETEIASRYFNDKESDIFEHRKEVTNWILECEAKISDHLERLSDKRSAKSCSSRSSRSSRSLQSARMKEKAKVAELMAERSLLREKIKLQAAEEQLQIDLEIAKAKAREKAFEELEKEQKLKLAEVTDESHDSFLALPTPATGRKHEQPSIPGNSPIRSTGVKVKREEREFSPLNPEKSEFDYHAFPAETKKEDVTHLTNMENEMLKEVFKIQHEQIQGMVASQHHLATAIALPEPEVRKFKGDPLEFKTFLMAFDARVQSRVTNSADRLYYLDQHLIGEPKELISGCLHIEPDEGYKEARRLLQREYGDPYKVSTAYMKRLTEWPPLKYDDGPALKSLYIFLSKCNCAMKTISHLAVLNHPPNMQAVVQKLPFALQTKWCEKRSENETQGRQDCRLRRTGRILGICFRVCK